MHFCPGVAEYTEPGKETSRLFLNQDTINKMNPSFAGRPVFVQHVDEPDDKKEDGYVVESFFNSTDGKTWCKFLVTTQRGLDAINNGWRLSNAYQPKNYSSGGQWNGVQYQKELIDAEYDHMAIVPNPRYDESIVLNPEQFKKYNETKKIELYKIANSQGEKSVFEIFKKEKIENALDLEKMLIKLPTSKVDMSLKDIVTGFDKVYNMHGYASPEHMVKAGDEEMSVNDMCESYVKNKKKLNKMEEDAKMKNDAQANVDVQKNADPAAAKSGGPAALKDGIELGTKAVINEEDEKKKKEDEEKMKNDSEAEMLKKEEMRKNSLAIKEQETAHLKQVQNSAGAPQVIRIDNLARGRELFG